MSNVDMDMVFETPDEKKVPCFTCEFRSPGEHGAMKVMCKKYPEGDKPLGILFNGDKCRFKK